MPGPAVSEQGSRSGFAPLLILAPPLLAFFGSAAAELAAFIATSLDRPPENLGLSTALEFLPVRWWWPPMIATVIAVWTPRFPWSPAALLAVARGGKSAGRATLGLIVWCFVASTLLAAFIFGEAGMVLVIAFAITLALIATLIAVRQLARFGAPDWSSTVLAAVILGAAMGAALPSAPRSFDCQAGATLRLKSGEEVACRSIDWFRDRRAVVARRADGSTRLVAKAQIDPAGLLEVLGPGALVLFPIATAD